MRKKEYANEFGIEVFNARKELNISQKKLAEALGVAQSYVSKLERGDLIPGVDVAIRMFHELKIPFKRLIDIFA